MFEQSLLTHPASEKRAGAMAASLTVEVMAISALAIIPMLYTERLIFNPPTMPLFFVPGISAPPELKTATKQRVRPSRPYVQFDLRSLIGGKTPPQTLVSIEPAPDGVSDPDAVLIPALPVPQFTTVLPPPPNPTSTAAPPRVDPVPTSPVRVSTDLQAAKLLRKIVPVYPQMAKMTRVQGTVALTGIIAKDGTVAQLNVTSGHPLLVKAALDAVRQWTYQPTILNGQAVEVVTTILVNFTLGTQ